MKAFKIFTFFLIFFMSSISFAQNTVEEVRSSDIIKEFGLFNTVQNASINPTQISNISYDSNSIYIDQIGSNNTISLKSFTESSTIDLTQNGNNNVVKLNFTALSAVENFHQLGDNHYLAAYGNTPSLNLQRTVNQTGSGQRLTIHGNNSISEKMQLNMKGATSTIIIRNFN